MWSKKKIIRNVIFVVALMLLLTILLLTFNDIREIWSILTSRTNWMLICLCVLITFIYCALTQMSLIVFIRKKDKNIGVFDLFSITGSEFFFNAITPCSSGGQPFQAYALKSRGMKLSVSTSVLLINFITYQTALNLISIVPLIFYFNKIVAEVQNVIWLLVIGYSINFLVLIFLIFIGCTKFAGNFMIKLLDLLANIKFLSKFVENRKEVFENYVIEMQDAFKKIANEKLCVLVSFILKTLSMLVYYSIPFFVFKAIGVKVTIEELFYIMSMTSFALTIAIWIPTPGASGGLEFAFETLFASVLALKVQDYNSMAVSGMVLWRFLTYYLTLIYGFICYLIFERCYKDENRSIY